MLGPVVRQYQEACEACWNMPVHRKRSRETRGIDALPQCEPGLEGARSGVVGGREAR